MTFLFDHEFKIDILNKKEKGQEEVATMGRLLLLLLSPVSYISNEATSSNMYRWYKSTNLILVVIKYNVYIFTRKEGPGESGLENAGRWPMLH